MNASNLSYQTKRMPGRAQNRLGLRAISPQFSALWWNALQGQLLADFTPGKFSLPTWSNIIVLGICSPSHMILSLTTLQIPDHSRLSRDHSLWIKQVNLYQRLPIHHHIHLYHPYHVPLPKIELHMLQSKPQSPSGTSPLQRPLHDLYLDIIFCILNKNSHGSYM